MANPNQSEKSNALDREENITKGNLSAKRVAVYSYDANTDTLLPVNSTNPIPITGSITASASTLADFSENDREIPDDIDETTPCYKGLTKPDGTWLVIREAITSVTYATVSNNGAVTSYTDAWTNRATLTYGRFDEAF